jgi:tRNA dimethylallyltransferase
VNKRHSLPTLALIAGPTASGKSDCAVALAQAIEARGKRAVVINADSAQVYADLRVLSARPSDAEMGGIEHRLFGTWDGARACSAAEWASAAAAEIEQVHATGGVPILVGHSRKGFLGRLLEQALGRPATDAERDAATAGAACGLAAAGVQVVRVHAVGLVRPALELFAATAQLTRPAG